MRNRVWVDVYEYGEEDKIGNLARLPNFLRGIEFRAGTSQKKKRGSKRVGGGMHPDWEINDRKGPISRIASAMDRRKVLEDWAEARADRGRHLKRSEGVVETLGKRGVVGGRYLRGMMSWWPVQASLCQKSQSLDNRFSVCIEIRPGHAV
jgi:hypothetical protein